MPSFAEIAAPVALLLPVSGMGASVPKIAPDVSINGSHWENVVPVETARAGEAPEHPATKKKPTSTRTNAFETFLQGMELRQIRVRQRVFVRITPRNNSSNRRNLVARPPQTLVSTRYKERKANDCVPVKRISSVQTGSGNRLILFMEDAQVMSINLEKACRARDFYAGFYVDKNEDGKMCVSRDTLQARNGAKCSIERMMQLVEVDD